MKYSFFWKNHLINLMQQLAALTLFGPLLRAGIHQRKKNDTISFIINSATRARKEVVVTCHGKLSRFVSQNKKSIHRS
jgi:hypothetical protein